MGVRLPGRAMCEIVAVQHEFDCDNCHYNWKSREEAVTICADHCAFEGIIPPCSPEKLAEINTVRLLTHKPLVGLGKLNALKDAPKDSVKVTRQKCP